jgi:hypothetical protein
MTTKSIFTVLFIFSAFISNTVAQNSDILWSRTYGGSDDEYVPIVLATVDGGYALAGATKSVDGDVTSNHGDGDAWLLKLDQDGNLLWQKTYGGSEFDKIVTLNQTGDQGYLLVGYTDSHNGDVNGNHGGTDGWVLKVDSIGSIQWKKCYGGTGTEFFTDVLIDDSNNYVYTAFTNSTDGDLTNNQSHGGSEVWLLKTDSVGTILSSHLYGTSGEDYGISICKGINGGYTVLARAWGEDGDVWGDYHPPSGDVWILMISSNGLVTFSGCYGGTELEGGSSLYKTDDGDYIVIAFSYSDDGDVTGHHDTTSSTSDFWILKINASGTLLWEKSYGGTSYDLCYSVVESGGNYFIAGYSESSDGDVINVHGLEMDAWIIKINSNGDLLWQQCYGGNKYDMGHSIIAAPDGGFVCAGVSLSSSGDVPSNQGTGDLWIFKLAATTDVSEIEIENSFQIFPNPASEVIHFKNDENKEATVSLFNLLGERVSISVNVAANQKIDINVSSLPRGLYILYARYPKGTVQKKIVLK